jgi:hypothetical protein
MKKLLMLLLLINAPAALVGCRSTAYVQHPGSANVLSSQAYDTLVATDAVIVQTRADLAKPGTFPAAWLPNIKTALNALITAYDAADHAWQAYNGAPIPANQAALEQNLGTMQAATTKLTATKGTGTI